MSSRFTGLNAIEKHRDFSGLDRYLLPNCARFVRRGPVRRDRGTLRHGGKVPGVKRPVPSLVASGGVGDFRCLPAGN